MAIYRLELKNSTRAMGHQSANQYQYITRTGKYKIGPEKTLEELIAHGARSMPSWAEQNPRKYWKAADDFERKNARLASTVIVALPVELGEKPDQYVRLIEGWVDSAFPKMPCSWAIHAGKGNNPHAHIMVSARANDGVERPPEMWFRRAAVTLPSKKDGPHKEKLAPDPASGGAPKSKETYKLNRGYLVQLRASWAEHTNQILASNGLKVKVTHLSNEAQRNNYVVPPNTPNWLTHAREGWLDSQPEWKKNRILLQTARQIAQKTNRQRNILEAFRYLTTADPALVLAQEAGYWVGKLLAAGKRNGLRVGILEGFEWSSSTEIQHFVIPLGPGHKAENYYQLVSKGDWNITTTLQISPERVDLLKQAQSLQEQKLILLPYSQIEKMPIPVWNTKQHWGPETWKVINGRADGKQSLICCTSGVRAGDVFVLNSNRSLSLGITLQFDKPQDLKKQREADEYER